MAKDLEMRQLGVIAHEHEVINRIVRPHRRSKKDQDQLMMDLAKSGWLVGLGVISVFDEKSPLFKADPRYKEVINKCYANRVAQHEHYKKNAKELAVELSCFEQAYCDKTGKVIRPTYVANTCNGRLDVYFSSQIMRAKG